ncbi:hypothetical protein CsSME_00037802 [Camellia sinensis var. sinensis]
MASKLIISFVILLILFHSVLSSFPVTSATEEKGLHGLEVSKISCDLSNKGYIRMSMILDQTLQTFTPSKLINNKNNPLNIFFPTDNAFFSLNPALQIRHYPWYDDGEVVKNEQKIINTISNSVDENVELIISLKLFILFMGFIKLCILLLLLIIYRFGGGDLH